MQELQAADGIAGHGNRNRPPLQNISGQQEMIHRMPVTLQLANQVIKLRHLTLAEIASELHRSEDEIAEACRMLLLPLPDADVEPPRTPPPEEEHAALRERIPKKWRDHYGTGE